MEHIYGLIELFYALPLTGFVIMLILLVATSWIATK